MSAVKRTTGFGTWGQTTIAKMKRKVMMFAEELPDRSTTFGPMLLRPHPYGFSAQKDLLALWSRFGRLPQRLATSYSTGRAQLLSLNQQVAANIEKGEPVMPPGVPKNYPDAKKLVTEDCIQPAGLTQ